MTNKKKDNTMGQLIRICILGWSAALLTASYAGTLSKMDPTFIATVFTASAATFGINTMKKSGGDEDDERKEEPKRQEFISAPPTPPDLEPVWTERDSEPVWTEPSGDMSLEERVESLETKVDTSGEGYVTPRTGA